MREDSDPDAGRDPETDPGARVDAGRPTHLDAEGRARMVDVSAKESTLRRARARAVVQLTPAVRAALFDGRLPKGDALAVARVAGIQAAKETSRLIPLCHAVPLASVAIELEPAGEDRLEIMAEAVCHASTGVEMEALTAASVAALTIYDMCKALCRGIAIGPIELVLKSGGRSGTWQREPERGPL